MLEPYLILIKNRNIQDKQLMHWVRTLECTFVIISFLLAKSLGISCGQGKAGVKKSIPSGIFCWLKPWGLESASYKVGYYWLLY